MLVLWILGCVAGKGVKGQGWRVFDNMDLPYALRDVACLYGRWVVVLRESDLAQMFTSSTRGVLSNRDAESLSVRALLAFKLIQKVSAAA